MRGGRCETGKVAGGSKAKIVGWKLEHVNESVTISGNAAPCFAKATGSVSQTLELYPRHMVPQA